MKITKPMLASTIEDLSSLKFPVLVTPKLDGIRCLKLNGEVLSRKFEKIPNEHIRNLIQQLPDGLDGELILENKTFNEIQSSVMTELGTPDFIYCIFDYVDSINTPYNIRIKNLEKLSLPDFCKKLIPVVTNNLQELKDFEKKCLEQKYEGVMIRSVSGPYKCGRSTLKDGYLLKLKRFNDSEAVIVGFKEQLSNKNRKIKDKLGYSKRSSHQENMAPSDTLGKFIVKEIGNTKWKNMEFAIGTGIGLTKKLRKEIWENKDKYLGKIITYTYQELGTKNLPRLPVYKGFRNNKDIS